MAPSAVATPTILTDPGYLFAAPLLSAVPANTVVASKFTDAWPVAWVPLGATADGSEFSYSIKTAPIAVAEFFDPIAYKTTDRTSSFTMNLADYTAAHLALAMNGATLTVLSGTTSTTSTKLVPPVPGSEVRTMIGWESLDNTVRVVCFQALQSGDLKMTVKKAPNLTDIPCTFDLEVPAGGHPFETYFAGIAGTAGGRG